DRAGHGGRRPADRAGGDLVEDLLRGRRGGRGLAKIDRGRPPVGHAHDHEATAAEVAGGRVRDRERERDGDRGVDGVATALEDADAGARGVGLDARDGARLAHDAASGREADRRIGGRGDRGRGRRRRDRRRGGRGGGPGGGRGRGGRRRGRRGDGLRALAAPGD